MYKNVIFDLYGTLVDIYTNEHDSELWATMSHVMSLYGANIPSQELYQLYFEYCRQQCQARLNYTNHPDIDVAKVYKDILSNMGVKVTKSDANYIARYMRTTSTQHLSVYSGVLELMSNLKKHGIKMYLLTNAQRIFCMPEIRQTGLKKYLSGIIISGDHGICKPDTELFQLLANKYDINLSDSIMIGNDYSSDIQGAINSGVDSIYIHSNISPAVNSDHPQSTYTVTTYQQMADILLG